VPTLDEGLFGENVTPLAFLQSLPQFFKHKMLPLPYAKMFFKTLNTLSTTYPGMKTIVDTYPLPLWIGPALTTTNTSIMLQSDNNLPQSDAAHENAIKEINLKELETVIPFIKKYPRIILQTPQASSITHPHNRQKEDLYAYLMRNFLHKFFQTHPETSTNCVTFHNRIYDFFVGFGHGEASSAEYQQLQQLCRQASFLQTIHLRCGLSGIMGKILSVYHELVLETDDSSQQYGHDEWQQVTRDMQSLLGIIDYDNPNPRARDLIYSPINHKLKTLRLLNYPLQIDEFQNRGCPRAFFRFHNVPNVIVHVPEGWQLTDELQLALQTCVDTSEILRSIELRTKYNGINWHQSEKILQFTKAQN
jgi:hypothetical protein